MKFDKEHTEIIIREILAGNGRVNACKQAGVNYQTFLNWLSDPDKIEFLEAVKNAEITEADNTKNNAIAAIKAKFTEQWQAAAWWLERKYPEEFRNRSEQDVSFKQHKDLLKAMFADADDEPK